MLFNATVVDNDAGDSGASIATMHLRPFGSVLANPATGVPVCAASATTSIGYNYDTDGTCALSGTDDVSAGPDPQLGALADNGGPTETLLPSPTSPLLNEIPMSNPQCPMLISPSRATDQRGVARPRGFACDIGSVER